MAATVGNEPLVRNRRLGRGGSSSRMIRSTSSKAPEREAIFFKGRVTSQQFVENTPSAYTSLRVSISSWLIFACSGLIYSRVPTICPYRVNIVLSVSDCSSAFATPKSITLGTGVSSYSATITLDGLISR